MLCSVPIDRHRVPDPRHSKSCPGLSLPLPKLSLRFLYSMARHLDMCHAASLYSPQSWLMVIGLYSGGLPVWICDHPLASRN
jgi:hypothetical protein